MKSDADVEFFPARFAGAFNLPGEPSDAAAVKMAAPGTSPIHDTTDSGAEFIRGRLALH
jgi:hypothetical protein